MIGSFFGEGGRVLGVFEGESNHFEKMVTTKMNEGRIKEYKS